MPDCGGAAIRFEAQLTELQGVVPASDLAVVDVRLGRQTGHRRNVLTYRYPKLPSTLGSRIRINSEAIPRDKEKTWL
jgi:hypothetical protein